MTFNPLVFNVKRFGQPGSCPLALLLCAFIAINFEPRLVLGQSSPPLTAGGGSSSGTNQTTNSFSITNGIAPNPGSTNAMIGGVSNASPAFQNYSNTPPASGGTNGYVVLPKSVPDPLEPLNRIVWNLNEGLMTFIVKPTAVGYRTVVVKPIRTGISNMGKNLNYPDRVINNLLQGKWAGARDETYRFLANTTIGAVGFFDVAEKKFKIHKSDADFGQTFGQWGWKPDFFLMLPIFGPSNDRDALGQLGDTYSNPLMYYSPYRNEFETPIVYTSPYGYFTYGVAYNDISDTVDEYVRFSQAQLDPYSELQYAWTFARENRVANYQVKGKQDPSSLETLESVFFTFKDPKFPDQGRTRCVRIPTTKRDLKYTYWLQPKKAPIVYIVPGLGSHRLASTSIALAELAYKNGFSAVSVSSPFEAEFMENASTVNLPAYLPVDGHDLHAALTLIDQHLHADYKDRIGERALMGYSMGAFQSMYIASTEATNQLPLVKFDRYVAINTPVRLLHGVSKLDEFYRAPLQWPAAERGADMENTFLKVADLSKSTMAPQTSLPFDAIESKFLIGITFRYTLRDIIFSSQRRHNEGILKHPISNLSRRALYREIMQYTYQDYFQKFAIPYYQSRGLPSPAQTLVKAGDLRTYNTGLLANPKIRVIDNENDFLLENEDLDWLRATFTPQQLTIFPQGGHLGNLVNPTVQKTILGALDGLK